jgi:hypothetical protein
MTDRQFLWGLSGGVSAFAVAGAFWFGLGASRIFTGTTPWQGWALATGLQAGACVGLLWIAFRLRRRAGFRRSELRQGGEAERAEARWIRTRFAWTVVGQALLIALAVWWCVHANAEEWIWPCISLVVSLHLAPLARMFHVREYYFTALGGGIVSILAFARLPGSDAVPILGVEMAVVMWLSAAYVAWKADRIAARAVRERWAPGR